MSRRLEPECVRVSNGAANSVESAWQQLESHESSVRKWTGERPCAIAREAEARIVMLVAQDEDDALAASTEPLKAVSDQASTDPMALSFGQHGHRRQGDGCHRSVGRFYQHATEEDVPDDPFLLFRDERGQHSAFRPQPIDQVAFVWAPERGVVH